MFFAKGGMKIDRESDKCDIQELVRVLDGVRKWLLQKQARTMDPLSSSTFWSNRVSNNSSLKSLYLQEILRRSTKIRTCMSFLSCDLRDFHVRKKIRRLRGEERISFSYLRFY